MSYYSQAQEEQPGITPQEEIQLRRVYDLLCVASAQPHP